MSVLDDIIQNVSANLVGSGTAAGFSSSNIIALRDDFAVLNFPPDPEAEWVAPNQMTYVIRLPEGGLMGSGTSGSGTSEDGGDINFDKFMQHFEVQGLYFTDTVAYADANAALALSNQVEKALKLAIKQLRGPNLANVTRGGNADNTINFTYERWAWGEGRGAGFTLNFDVIYRTLQNDPDTKA